MESGLVKLLRSRRFILALLDAIGSTLAIVGAMVLAPAQLENAIKIVGIWQPVILLVIVSYTVEEVAATWAMAIEARARVAPRKR